MNAPDRALVDVQSWVDQRNVDIDAAGIKRLRYPVTIRAADRLVATVAQWSMAVALPSTAKGTHMSRFLELLEDHRGPLDQHAFRALCVRMLQRLGASRGAIAMRFPWFASKFAPVSGIRSRLDYDVRWQARAWADGRYGFAMRVEVPATSLCPCSKEISAYGAHNQRSLIAIDAEIEGEVTIDELIAVAERSASCEVFGLLKRPDEKYVTERAYENPKFAEDLARDVAVALRDDTRIRAFTVEVENFESIHNHSAFASVVQHAGLPSDA